MIETQTPPLVAESPDLSTLRGLFVTLWGKVRALIPSYDVAIPREVFSLARPLVRLVAKANRMRPEDITRWLDVAAERGIGTDLACEYMGQVIAGMREEQYVEFCTHLVRFADAVRPYLVRRADVCGTSVSAPQNGATGGLLWTDGDGQDHARGGVAS